MWYGELFLDGLIHCSDLCICGTFITVFLKLRQSRSAAGLSLQTLATVVGARCLHLISHHIGLHYTPAVLPWQLFTAIDIVNALAGVVVLASFLTIYYPSYEKAKDNFGIHVFEKLGILDKTSSLRESPALAATVLYSGVATLAFGWYFIRRSHHSFWISYFCCFYEALGAVALIPQLWMFHQDKKVSNLLANFVVLTALNRFFTLMFWIFYPKIYFWRYPDNRGIQMVSEILNLAILSDFLYYWARSKIRGEKEVVLDLEV